MLSRNSTRYLPGTNGLDKLLNPVAPITEEKRHADSPRSFAPLIVENITLVLNGLLPKKMIVIQLNMPK